MQHRTKQALISLIFLSVVGVNGCGQKRPLYIPEAPAENTPETSTNIQAPANSGQEQA